MRSSSCGIPCWDFKLQVSLLSFPAGKLEPVMLELPDKQPKSSAGWAGSLQCAALIVTRSLSSERSPTWQEARAALPTSVFPPLTIMLQSSAGTPGRPGLRLQVVVCVLFLCVTPAALHPQCLDFKPPFRPDRDLEFCIMYREFGCCDRQKDQELMARYYRIIENFTETGHENCVGFVLELLCQVSVQDKGQLVQHAGFHLIKTSRFLHNMKLCSSDTSAESLRTWGFISTH